MCVRSLCAFMHLSVQHLCVSAGVWLYYLYCFCISFVASEKLKSVSYSKENIAEFL